MSEPPTNIQFSLRTLLVVVTLCAIALGLGPLVALVSLYALFFAHVRRSARTLPKEVISKFDFRGEPIVRVNREIYLSSIMFLAVFAPLFPAGLALLCLHKVVNYRLVNLMAWLVCLLMTLIFIAHALTVEANHRSPPKMPFAVWVLVPLFLACLGLWTVAFAWQLKR